MEILLPTPPGSDRLFTPRFFMMCGFTFTVFLSAFQLFPTAPLRIIDLGGTEFTAGLFLGFLTYSSAFSAPFTGGLADRLGKRRMLIVCSSVLTLFSIAYGISPSYEIPLVLVVFHGIFWSGLLSASSAYMTDIIPPRRRAEGIGYWGLSSVAAIAVAPSLGIWIYHFGWGWLCASISGLNVLMAGIAVTIRKEETPPHSMHPFRMGTIVEWRVLALAMTLFLYSFGYGGITSFSALFAMSRGIAPSSLYLTVLAVVILLTRPFSGRLADRISPRRVFLPCLALIALGLGMLSYSDTMPMFVLSAIVFGAGYGTAYPVFVASVFMHVSQERRGAAFGSILAAFDTGIGSGSVLTGLLVEQFGFSTAFGAAAALAALSIPYYLYIEKRVLRESQPPSDPLPAG